MKWFLVRRKSRGGMGLGLLTPYTYPRHKRLAMIKRCR